MTFQRAIDAIEMLRPCSEAMVWLRNQQSTKQAWRDCKRGDWMLWLLGRTAGQAWSDSRRPLVGCAAECAMLAPSSDDKYELARQWAIDAASRWSIGECDEGELSCAADAAAYAAYAAYAADATADAAADAAAYAAAADAAAADAAAAAAYAADAAAADAAAYAAAADAAAAYAERDRILAECADIVRLWFPEPPDLAAFVIQEAQCSKK